MGTNDSNNTTPAPQIGQAEMQALAARLRARANSVVFRDQPVQQSDLRTAAALIERLVHVLAELRRVADNAKDDATEDHLREILGTAGVISPESKG